MLHLQYGFDIDRSLLFFMKNSVKIVIFSAPSGAGKSTIIRHLIDMGLPLEFSISATSRPPRGKERDGVEYYFLTAEEFRRRIEAGEFVEYEMVYKDRYYGTLKSELNRIADMEKATIMDVDVKGALNIKKQYGDNALSIFVMPPSVEELRRRLETRGTDSADVIEERVRKAEYEMSFATKFDKIIINADLHDAEERAAQVVREFLG